MGSKAIKVASLVFAVIIVSYLGAIWNNYTGVMRVQNDRMNGLSASEIAFDVSLFDGKTVTADTVTALQQHMNKLGASSKGKLEIEINGTSTKYKAELEKNVNGVVHKVIFTGV